MYYIMYIKQYETSTNQVMTIHVIAFMWHERAVTIETLTYSNERINIKRPIFF